MNETNGSHQKPVVAHVVLGLKVGGLERVVVNLVQGLRDNYRPLVVCLEEGGAFQAELERDGVPVTVIGKREGVDWTTIRRMAVLFREHGVRVVHTHNPAPHFHGVMAALWARVPVRVHTKHGRNYPNDKKKVRINRFISRFTDVVAAVSDDARDVALEVEKVPASRVRRIWNGVDTDRYRPGSSVEARPPVIGTVARLSPEKDQRTMLAAFQLVLKEMPTAQLVLAGDGPSADDLKSYATELGISRNVEFLGVRTDVATVLDTFALFTLSSTTEGLSMTVLEAMSAGLPVVATDVGGNREVVNPPECGLVVPARDPKELANAYLALLREPDRRARMGDAARARVIGTFSLRQMVTGYGEIYQELLARKCGCEAENSMIHPVQSPGGNTPS